MQLKMCKIYFKCSCKKSLKLLHKSSSKQKWNVSIQLNLCLYRKLGSIYKLKFENLF